MTEPVHAGLNLLERSLLSDRIYSAYLLAGPGDAPREAARQFVRGLVCTGESPRPCDECTACRRSTDAEPLALDGSKGPYYRHVGDHSDLYWVERGTGDTRIRIDQIRELQNALRLQPEGEGRRAAVIAEAEWLNDEAQSALLRILEEPPPRTSFVLVTTHAAGLRATVRSRCQKLSFQPEEVNDLKDPEHSELIQRLREVGQVNVPGLLDWAEEYRGARAPAAAGVQTLLRVATSILHEQISTAVRQPDAEVDTALQTFKTLHDCRKALAQRNANPQMVAERALFALRDAWPT
ncbi:hypothetical protein MK489_04415 [Myxococcota bacterium]|nr:hypothetical protein [Myxococcota bacterium]